MAIKLEYVPLANYERKKPTECKYNKACWCLEKTCWCCGWNPTVYQKRLAKLMSGGV